MPINDLTAPDGDLSMNSFKITNLANATVATDALNRQTGDGRYYLNSATLDQIIAPITSVSLNNQKISSLANPTTGTDALNR